jgi:hypothetical protein
MRGHRDLDPVTGRWRSAYWLQKDDSATHQDGVDRETGATGAAYQGTVKSSSVEYAR